MVFCLQKCFSQIKNTKDTGIPIFLSNHKTNLIVAYNEIGYFNKKADNEFGANVILETDNLF